ncbi:ligand-gated channel protein [Pandoraea sp. NE5]|uniref:TonB-dependent siderophore receptor n=1 Tax=unclassified Pandoraea TaxID=2624094 RepID=UPI0003476834|nr:MULTISPECIES: TonB-dependent siderophore receptor [unclassified Pandoraea]OJY19364.1 MAG: IclR family transcriptional regulator [Pandoraea sp. 64-18]BDD90924.1 ligand-gated channel protein [Pandoraea sp. NE5]
MRRLQNYAALPLVFIAASPLAFAQATSTDVASSAAVSATNTDTATPDATSVSASGTVALPAVSVSASGAPRTAFDAPAAAQVTKSSVPLSETPQSISVVTRDLMDAQQVQTLNDALHDVPGVISGTYGRRGWDDFIIRGQTASDSVYLDGLRTAINNRFAEETFGLQQIEVIKGPATLLSGLVLPGGMVNMVSKRPEADTFANVDATVGSHGFYQSTVDMGTPLSENGKAAFRINALATNSHDATDYVWSRNRYIAPSLSLDLGPRTELTILTSYQERNYLRQQGLPWSGTLIPNKNGSLSRSTFTGEPGERPYSGHEARIGYRFAHHFDSGWTVNQNARWQQFALGGQLVANGKVASNGYTLSRTATDSQWSGDTLSLDNNAQKTFDTAFGRHEITVGMDYMRGREDVTTTTCSVGSINMYAPVYTGAITCPSTPRTRAYTTIRDLGVYARDQIALGQRWRVLAGMRYDSASSNVLNKLTDTTSGNPSNATTGSLALMYELFPGVRPYVSYATSFYPNSGADVSGNAFDPETGKQWEAGVKFDLQKGHTSVTLAAFDLRRRNVLESDPNNDGYSIAVGEEHSRGVEVSFNTAPTNQLSVTGGYAYTSAVIADDGGQAPSTNGVRINNVPRHSFNLFARYRLPGELRRWEINGGVRGQSNLYAYGYTIPGFVVSDVGVRYTAPSWHAALNLKNIFNKHYYTGGLSNAVALGDDRSVMLTLGYRY